MKRLICNEQLELQINDNVRWKNNDLDTDTYVVTDVLPDGSVMIDNGEKAITNVKPSTLIMA